MRRALARLARTACSTALLVATLAGTPDLSPAAPPGGMLSPPAPVGRPPALSEVGYDQRLGESVPLDARFRASDGEDIALRDLLGERPVVLMLAYYGCPMLCPLSMEGLARALKPLTLDVGKDFDVVVASFDPRDEPSAAAHEKETALGRYGRPGTEDGWHFLTGSPESIAALTRAVGFRYAKDRETGEFAHPAGVVVLTPEGRISRYLFGLDPSPRDLRLALVESSAGTIGSAVDQVLLYCFRYDPAHGRYSAVTLAAVRIAGAVTAAMLGLFLLTALWRERRRRAHAGGRA